MMPKITEMFAFVVEEKPGDEGIIGFAGADGTWVPLVGGDMTRVKDLIPYANAIAKSSGLPYKIMHFKLVGELKK